jgi:RNA polymerase sigma-70 factor (ECF subfamily)
MALNRTALAAVSNNAPRALSPDQLASLSDAEVMLRVAAGDNAAFDYLVAKYRRPLVHFMYRMSRNQAVAEELAQEAFLRVYRSRSTYAAEAKFTTWLYRIATNLAVNHARDHRYDKSAVSLEQSLLRRERLARIRQTVQDLPERQRTAVLMHKYQGLDYRQIGEVLKLSESATKSLLFRAYETLREELKDLV